MGKGSGGSSEDFDELFGGKNPHSGFDRSSLGVNDPLPAPPTNSLYWRHGDTNNDVDEYFYPRVDRSVTSEEPDMLDGHSLTSAFSKLSFGDRLEAVNNGTLDSELASSRFNQPHGDYLLDSMESQTSLPPYCHLNQEYGFTGENGKHTSNMMAEGQRTHYPSCCPQYKYLPGAFNLSQGLQSSYLLRNVAAHPVELPSIPSHQQQFMVPQLPYALSQHQQLGLDEMRCRQYLEEDRNLMMLQHLYNLNMLTQCDGARKNTYSERFQNRSHGMNSRRFNNFRTPNQFLFKSDLNHRGRTFSNGHPFSPNYSWRRGDSLCQHTNGPSILHDNLRSPFHGCESLEELSGIMHLAAKDEVGCRYLQRKIAEGTTDDIPKVFDGIIPHIVDLMKNPFGHQLVHKLLDVCTEDQRLQIIHAITKEPGELLRISCNEHGTNIVQKIIETLTTSEQSSLIVSSLLPGLMTLMKNVNGKHIVQRCLESLNPEHKEFFYEVVISNHLDLAKDSHGCCLLQKCLDQSDGKNGTVLVRKIISDALALSQDPYGNYVVQYVLQLQISWANRDIIHQLKNHYCFLSRQKHSSHVVERCLELSGEEDQSIIIQEMIAGPQLDQLLNDRYGNYVIQVALNNSKGAAHTAIVNAIRPRLPRLQMSKYGKRILQSNGLRRWL